jgi:hypothetical protein
MAVDRTLKLVVEKGPLAGSELSLSADRSMTVGRREGADVLLTGDDFVSLEHAEVLFMPSGALLRNKSANGTLVNGIPITEVALAVGDRISVGLLHLLRVTSLPAPPAPPASRAERRPGAAEPAPAATAGVPSTAKAASAVKPGWKVPVWLVAYLALMVVAGVFLGITKFRSGKTSGLAEIRIQEQKYAADRQWSDADTQRVVHLLETAIVHERRGDIRSAYEAYRETLGVRRPIDPYSPAYRYAAARMAVLGPNEPRAR